MHLQRNTDFIKKFSLATWNVDADVAINVILMILKLEWLGLCIGINFEPEQLKHLFHEPIPNLRYLSLRFRPYGLKASGHHFLMGTYFDSAPTIIATWPSAEFPATGRPNSIVRATPNFHLNHLSVLASSPLLARTQTLRLCIPGREPVSVMHAGGQPSLTVRDLLTFRVSIADVSSILRSLPPSSSTAAACSTMRGARLGRFSAPLHARGRCALDRVRREPSLGGGSWRGGITAAGGARPPARVGAAHAVAAGARTRGHGRAARAPRCVPAWLGRGRGVVQQVHMCRSAAARKGGRPDASVSLAWGRRSCATGARLTQDGGCRRGRGRCFRG
ncbi:hypothetical protein EDB83DRAFT_550695 [Lactarius deliciosus]|nr:hypothetical protein EDB83DRAFT_550695 [Lactarius deliciosus]